MVNKVHILCYIHKRYIIGGLYELLSHPLCHHSSHMIVRDQCGLGCCSLTHHFVLIMSAEGGVVFVRRLCPSVDCSVLFYFTNKYSIINK
jgi:hypothetical protein